ncbi:aminotransferase class I/II-fold pyridoxal phosphate-dependent enzyme [Rhodococcus chondri]|uniref:Aminotransferase class I/II-fold pyridoxal phosphate-dependent enzyme n=1 Tax=Rhodococcus chondri TaxID=3065941 RepID=A0ABU7JW00_9NOCA|nr:aminotransferase class I/II-fold pyridoxal phosphate-dependent enzyme [Rhodococcus sp. CC-R104]MEE2034191.1 aminotransferase class I/II-fold pyridoxal phosphate-dependent enzyme [Rhodococcus sp. CC-R104]
MATRHGSGTYVAAPAGRVPRGDALRGAGGPLDLGVAAPRASPYLGPAYERGLKHFGLHTDSHGYVPDGLPALRRTVAARYTARGLPTDAEQVLVTAGAGDALDVVLRTLLVPGCRVLHEHPSYPEGLDAITAIGGTPVPVAVDAAHPAGIVAAVDRVARQHAPTIAYLMPDHSNPSGTTLDLATRRALAATLARHHIIAVIDEVTAELGTGGDTEPFGVRVPELETGSDGDPVSPPVVV